VSNGQGFGNRFATHQPHVNRRPVQFQQRTMAPRHHFAQRMNTGGAMRIASSGPRRR